jgi:hypothetical protein
MADGHDRGPARVAATLVYDTKRVPGPPGIRATLSRARRLLYVAGDAELVLEVVLSLRPSHVRLTGQVLIGGAPADAVAIDLRRDARVLGTVTDDDGEFRIGDLPWGRYGLDCHLMTRTVGVDAIDLS